MSQQEDEGVQQGNNPTATDMQTVTLANLHTKEDAGCPLVKFETICCDDALLVYSAVLEHWKAGDRQAPEDLYGEKRQVPRTKTDSECKNCKNFLKAKGEYCHYFSKGKHLEDWPKVV
jgi:hypothetical protein